MADLDFSSIIGKRFDDLFAQQSQLAESLQGQRQSIIEEQNRMTSQYEPTIGGTLAATLAPLAGALIGGSLGSGGAFNDATLGVGAKASELGANTYFNNLEANRKKREADLASQLQFLDTSLLSTQRELPSLQLDSLKSELGIATDYAKGQFIGTEPWKQSEQSKLANTLAMIQARQTGDPNKQPLSDDKVDLILKDKPELAAWVKQKNAEGAGFTMADIKTMQSENRQGIDAAAESRRKTGQDVMIGKSQSFEYPNIPGTYTSEAQNNKFQTMLGGAQRAKTALDQIKEKIKNGDPVTDLDAGLVAANSSELFAALRDFQKTGMRLEGREAQALDAMQPSAFSSQQGWASYFAGKLRDTSSPEFIDGVKGVLNRAIAAEARGVNKYDPYSKNSYDSDFVSKVTAAGGKWGDAAFSRNLNTTTQSTIKKEETKEPDPHDFPNNFEGYLAAHKQWEQANGK